MGIFDRFRHQARGKGKDTSDAVEQKINERTGGTYESQVDQAQQRAEGSLGMDRDADRGRDRGRPEQP
ncbi:antitoxin [Streptomyces sp. NPDC018693]|uniref:antitoxin n=1 Tax=unclassified Streptomyces TaxID=2593676 RepID=UPI0037B24CAC